MQDTIAEITAKAATDAAFRQSLLENSAATLAQYGFTLAANTRVRFIERLTQPSLIGEHDSGPDQ